MFQVVIFTEDNEVTVVTDTWINKVSNTGAFCYWPKSRNATTLAKKRAQVENSWKNYQVKLMCEHG